MPAPIFERQGLDRLKFPNWENFRRDIGGKFVGDHRAFTFFVPIAWLLSMVGYDVTDNPELFTARMIANGIAFAICYLILFLFRRTIFRDRHQRTISLLTVIAAGITLGVSKVAITAALTSSFTGIWDSFDSLLVRVLAGAVTGAWYLPLAAIVLAIQDRFRTVREIVFAERLRRHDQAPGLSSTDPAQVQLAVMLNDIRQTVTEQQAQPEALAESLNQILEKDIRPFSRRLWSRSGRKSNDVSAIELVRIVLSRSKYWPTLTTLAILLASAPAVISTVGWLEGLARLAVLGSFAFAALVGLVRTQPVRAMPGLVIFSSVTLAFAFINETLVFFLFGQFGSFTFMFDVVLNAGLFTVLAMLLGILRLTRDELRDLEKEIVEIFGEDYFSGRIDLERSRIRQRELANLIHGRLQNQILGVILALTKNPDSTSAKELLEEIKRLELSITSKSESEGTLVNVLLSEELESLATRWLGIIQVNISPELPDSMSAEDIAVCVSLAEEGITNAVRHGLASSVSITLDRDHDKFILSISDDGVGPRNGPPGLGTLNLNQITGNSWSLSANPSGVGSILRAHIDDSAKSQAGND